MACSLLQGSRDRSHLQVSQFCLLLQATLCGALPEERTNALRDFIHDKTTTVLTVVMSTGGGAAGLTLTVASTVFLLEPNLNIGLETQAAGRVHRLGGLLTIVSHADDQVPEAAMPDSARLLQSWYRMYTACHLAVQAGTGSCAPATTLHRYLPA